MLFYLKSNVKTLSGEERRFRAGVVLNVPGSSPALNVHFSSVYFTSYCNFALSFSLLDHRNIGLCLRAEEGKQSFRINKVLEKQNRHTFFVLFLFVNSKICLK